MINFSEAFVNVFIFLFLLGSAAFFSGVETALFSLDRIHLERLQQTGGIFYRWIQYLLSRSHRLLVTAVAGNELSNMVLATFLTSLLHDVLLRQEWSAYAPVINALVLTPIILIFGDITPKAIALRNNVLFARICIGPLLLFYHLLTPIRVVAMVFVRLCLRAFHIPAEKDEPLREEEFLALLHQSRTAGHIDSQDQQFIHNVFEFSAHRGGDIMTPLSRTVMLPVTATIPVSLQTLVDSGYSKLPVFEEEREHVVGVVYARDLLKIPLPTAPESVEPTTLRAIMRPVLYVGEDWPVNKILKEMKRSRRQIVMVNKATNTEDKNKVAIGMITMEDIIEELFGPIEDERDREENS